MQYLLTEQQKARHGNFKAFVNQQVEPFAEEWDREQKIPESVISMLAKSGYLGCSLPSQYGGQGWDTVTFGLLSEALGSVLSSLTVVLTVQAMVSMSLLKWGSVEQKQQWLPLLAKGEIIGAFALTEPGAGSDLKSLVTEFTPSQGGALILNGAKTWISCAQFASLFLVFGNLGDRSLACLVPRETRGLEVEPIHDLMGFRAAGLAKLTFKNVEVPLANVVGKPGFALSHVAPVGLHYGRISTACSALGLCRGCFDESVGWAATRKIGGQPLGDIGMIRSLIPSRSTLVSDLVAGDGAFGGFGGDPGRDLRGEGRALAGAPEVLVAGRRPGKHVTQGVGDGNDGVVERGLDMCHAVGYVTFLFFLDHLLAGGL